MEGVLEYSTALAAAEADQFLISLQTLGGGFLGSALDRSVAAADNERGLDLNGR